MYIVNMAVVFNRACVYLQSRTTANH